MIVKPRTVTRSVKVMRNPNPQFVSLVDHGSIQEPFTALKAAKPSSKPTGADKMPIKSRQPTKKADATESAQKPVTRVRKVVFAKEQYGDEKAVKQYLADNNYAGFVISEDDKTFTAQGEGVEDTHFDNVKKIEMEEGVEGFVGILTEEGVKKFVTDEDGATDEEDEDEPADDSVLKFDWYRMYCAKGESVKDILAEGMCDGVPPGVMEVVQATAYAIGNVLKADGTERATKLTKIGKEMAGIVGSIADVYEEALKTSKKKDAPDNVKKFVAAVDEFIGQAQAKKFIFPSVGLGTGSDARNPDAPPPNPNQPPHNSDAVPRAPKTTGSPVAATPPNPTVYPRPGEHVPQKGDEADPNAAMFNKLAEFIGGAVQKAVEPLNAQMTELATKVEAASTAATAATEQVTKLAARAPTKKAAAEAGENKNPTNDAEKSVKSEGLRNFRSTIGM